MKAKFSYGGRSSSAIKILYISICFSLGGGFFSGCVSRSDDLLLPPPEKKLAYAASDEKKIPVLSWLDSPSPLIRENEKYYEAITGFPQEALSLITLVLFFGGAAAMNTVNPL